MSVIQSSSELVGFSSWVSFGTARNRTERSMVTRRVGRARTASATHSRRPALTSTALQRGCRTRCASRRGSRQLRAPAGRCSSTAATNRNWRGASPRTRSASSYGNTVIPASLQTNRLLVRVEEVGPPAFELVALLLGRVPLIEQRHQRLAFVVLEGHRHTGLGG